MKTVAVLLIAILAGVVPVQALEVVIGPERLEPRVLQATTADRVMFVNRSGRVVHVEFGPDRERHHVFQVPGEIWAMFHRSGTHAYVVHFETGPRREFHGVVEVDHVAAPGALGLPVCTEITVLGVCLEP